MSDDGSRSDSTLEGQMAERRAKAAKMIAAGDHPYRNDWKPDVAIAQLRAEYASTRPAADAPKAERGAPIVPIDGKVVRVAGRALARRGFGKSAFIPIRDRSGDLQLYLTLDATANFAATLEAFDLGDIVGAEGQLFWTKTGELSLLVARFVIVSKALRPLPDKWHGLTDVEQRYRQRYVDLAIDPAVREVFTKRSRLVAGIRRFLDARGFLEVETPMMHPIIGGAAARPFVTHHNTLDMRLYMRIAPELYLKRLVVGGFDRVYEINRNFRNEGLSRAHNPEFTMLEFYWAYAVYTDLMDLTEELITGLAQDLNGSLQLTWDGVDLDLARPWRRITVRDAVHELGGLSKADTDALFTDPEAAARIAAAHHVSGKDIAQIMAGAAGDADDLARRVRAGHLGYLVFEQTAEAKLVQPTFLTDFPLAVSPLARKRDSDPAFCDRFELFVAGREIANGFSELNDPDDQRARFQAQVAAKAGGADETMDYDEDYCRALEIGMPPAAGEGIGIDRLAMMLTGQSSIRDVILFPLMRPE